MSFAVYFVDFAAFAFVAVAERAFVLFAGAFRVDFAADFAGLKGARTSD
jgi:hypothetical protein